MTVKAGFIQSGSADGRCELAMTVNARHEQKLLYEFAKSV
jgi:hypothetical protein